MSLPVTGSVQLSDKLTPVCSREEPFDESYAYLRATFDHSLFKRKIVDLPPQLWDDEHQEGNVKVSRDTAFINIYGVRIQNET
jgi:hypothetical protein